MRIKTILALFLALALMLLATPAYALGLGVSPAEVEVDVPAHGSTEVNFKVYKFTGDISVELESIPLRVEPQIISVVAEGSVFPVILTIHGDPSLGNQMYRGYINFLGMGEGDVGLQIKVVATVNHIASGQLLEEATLEEAPTPAEQAPPEEAPAPSTPPGPPVPAPPVPPAPTSEFPIVLVAGIAAGAAIIITLIVVFVRRPRW